MTKIFHQKKEFINHRNTIATENIVGVVPTMGNLHPGHLSLVKQAIKENDVTIVTIFVNPYQFGPNEDFLSYPRTLEQDIELIEELKRDQNKKIVIFAPKTNSDMFSEEFNQSIDVGDITKILCGKSRPTHFAGVISVVHQIFRLTRPDNAYFGQKDYQQYIIIEKIVQKLNLNIKINRLPIVREKNGLAYSSRNQYLTANEKEQALRLNKTIKKLSTLIEKEIKTNATQIKKEINEFTKLDPNWDYLEALDAKKLNTVTTSTEHIVVAGAYRIGTTRLIDNNLIKL